MRRRVRVQRGEPERTAAEAPASDQVRDTGVAAQAGNAAVGRLLQRAADPAAGSSAPQDFAERLSTGGGQAIPSDVRENLESGLGVPLADVRVHTDQHAATMASEVSAHAFTVGSDIYFGQGRYEPRSDSGFHLLAHEVTHTVQQQGATAGGGELSVSRPHDPAEREADHVAGQLASGRSVAAAPGPASTSVQRFGSTEHKQIGDTSAGPGQGTTIRYSENPAEVLSFGEVVALSGDYFGTLTEMEKLSATPEGRQQILYARWYSLRQGAEPAVDESVKKEVKNRYFNLAAKNVSHFSAGGDAAPTYQDGHKAALRRAFLAGLHNSADDMRAAMTAEAAAQHYLTDMFSGGHVRTPRREIQQWYQSNFADSPTKIKNLLVERLLKHLNDIDKDQLKNIPDFLLRGKVAKIVEDLGGPAIRSFSLGDIVSLSLHNFDNAQGVQVSSKVDAAGAPASGPWTAYGDNKLNAPEAATTLNMVVAASKASILELEKAAQLGRTRGGGGSSVADEDAMAASATAAITPFAALAYVPSATKNNVPVTDAAGKDANELAWHWGSFTALTHKAVNDTVAGEIAGVVDAIKVGNAAGIIEQDAGWPIGKLQLHGQDALKKIVEELRKRGIDVITDAIGSKPGGA